MQHRDECLGRVHRTGRNLTDERLDRYRSAHRNDDSRTAHECSHNHLDGAGRRNDTTCAYDHHDGTGRDVVHHLHNDYDDYDASATCGCLCRRHVPHPGLHRRDPFAYVTDLLTEPDLMFVNLETTIAERGVGAPLGKRFTFKSPPASVELLTEAGIDGVQLANNHIEDYRRRALLRTLELLDNGGLPHAGAGAEAAEAYDPAFLEATGRTVGLVAFSRIPCSWARSGKNTRPEVAWTCKTFVENTLAAADAAAEAADVVVVMVHWGLERNYCPETYQRELAVLWQAHGADLIIGSHPHVLQGVEQIRDAWLVHSTGNFAFPSARGVSAASAIFEFTVTTEATSLKVIPIVIRGGRPRPADDPARSRILRDLTSHSFGVAFTDDGTAIETGAVAECGPVAPLPPEPLSSYPIE